MKISTRYIVQAGMIAAAYSVAVIGLAPISFGPLQLRAANVLKATALLSPGYGLGLAFGVFLGNLSSPFGAWDWGVMPIVELAAAAIVWKLRRWPVVALALQALLTGAAVSVFPLYLGGGIPIIATIPGILVAQALTVYAGYFLIRTVSKYKPAPAKGQE